MALLTTYQLILLVIVLIVIHVLLIPLALYFTIRTTSRRNATIMQKRNIGASIISSYCAIGWLFTTAMAHYMFLFHTSSLTYKILSHISHITYAFLSHGELYALLFRFWMIYFTFSYSVSISNQKWKTQINPQGCTTQEIWIINHHNTWGRPKWIAKKLVIIYIVTAPTIALVYIFGINNLFSFNYSSAFFIDTLFFLSPLFVIFVLWWKTPKFADLFLCRQEMRLLIIMYSISLLIAVVNGFVQTFVPELAGSYWEQAIITLNQIPATFGIIFVQTGWVLIKIERNPQYYGEILKENQNENSMNMMKTNMKLRGVLENCDLFEAFMGHLSKELSSECLLSFIEFTQFRELLESKQSFMVKVNDFTHINIQKQDDHMQIITDRSDNACVKRKKIDYRDVTLPNNETIPKSAIVYEGDKTIREIAEQLCHKYVHEYGSFCINIGYGNRNGVVDWVNTHCIHEHYDAELDEKQCFEMYNLFEQCRKEMYRLMHHNCERFMKTDVFEQLNPSKNQYQ